jgi:hypothetical protein
MGDGVEELKEPIAERGLDEAALGRLQDSGRPSALRSSGGCAKIATCR